MMAVLVAVLAAMLAAMVLCNCLNISAPQILPMLFEGVILGST